LQVKIEELNDTEIVGSCFSQESAFTEVFPDGMVGVTFRHCNLDNCIIPVENAMVNCTNKHFNYMADGERWIVDSKGKAISPLHPDRFDKWEISKDPADIVSSGNSKFSRTQLKERAYQKAIGDFMKDKASEAVIVDYLKTTGKI